MRILGYFSLFLICIFFSFDDIKDLIIILIDSVVDFYISFSGGMAKVSMIMISGKIDGQS